MLPANSETYALIHMGQITPDFFTSFQFLHNDGAVVLTSGKNVYFPAVKPYAHLSFNWFEAESKLGI